MYHPEHSSTILSYLRHPENSTYKQAYKNQHPKYIEVSPVGACNHRCTFCSVDYIGYNSIFIDFERYKKSIDSMKGKECGSIMFAGEGEPLLHPNISEFVNYTKEVGGIDTAFTTNAYRLTSRFIKDSMKNISWIKVSFNAGTSSSYANIHRCNEKDFSIVVDNIRRAVEYKVEKGLKTSIGMQMVLLPENSDTVHSLCTLAKDIGVDYVVIKPYSQHKLSSDRDYKDIDYREYLSLEEELEQYNEDKFNVIFRVNTIKNWISQNKDRYCHCIATPSVWAYWMADGSVYTCSAFLLDKRFMLGNINEKTFDQIWTTDRRLEHSKYVLNELDINECRVNCRMDHINRYLDSIVNKKIDHANFV